MIIAVDFDGTIVTHRYPNIGEDIGAFNVLSELLAAGHQLILFTMRSGARLDEAIEHCRTKRIEFYGVNANPIQSVWTDSPKAYANLYIDDAGLGIPLIYPEAGRPYVNWNEVRKLLLASNIL